MEDKKVTKLFAYVDKNLKELKKVNGKTLLLSKSDFEDKLKEGKNYGNEISPKNLKKGITYLTVSSYDGEEQKMTILKKAKGTVPNERELDIRYVGGDEDYEEVKMWAKDKNDPFLKFYELKESKLSEAELAPQEIDVNEFPNPMPEFLKKHFKVKGHEDGVKDDDKVKTTPVAIDAKKLKPSQEAIYLAKTLAMAIGGVAGGELGAVISKDNYILDGHHRWAATLFNDPSAKIKGYRADLNIGDLIPVLRALGDSFGNERRGTPRGGDINLFDASIKQAMAVITKGTGIDAKWYDNEKAMKWLESKGGEAGVAKSLALAQSILPPADAPKRSDMPVIDPEKGEVKKTAKLLNKGAVDVRKPYAKDERKMKDNKRVSENRIPSYGDFVNESKLNEFNYPQSNFAKTFQIHLFDAMNKIQKKNGIIIYFEADGKSDNIVYVDDKAIGKVNGNVSINDIEKMILKYIKQK